MMVTVSYKGPTDTLGTRLSVALIDGAETIDRAMVARNYGANLPDDMRYAAREMARKHMAVADDEPLGRVNGRTVFAVTKGGE